jgi:hypothetical protein
VGSGEGCDTTARSWSGAIDEEGRYVRDRFVGAAKLLLVDLPEREKLPA